MFQNSIVNVGTFISMPIFHYFNLNDNIIILLAFGSAISIRIVKVFARSEEVFFASTAFGVFMGVSSAPIRAQMTRCVAAVELGKVKASHLSLIKSTFCISISFYILQVFAMLASLESAVPILASAIFTNLYNATSELTYPWQGSFYFGCIGFSSIGMALKMDIGCIVKTETTYNFYRCPYNNICVHIPWMQTN